MLRRDGEAEAAANDGGVDELMLEWLPPQPACAKPRCTNCVNDCACVMASSAVGQLDARPPAVHRTSLDRHFLYCDALRCVCETRYKISKMYRPCSCFERAT